MGLSIDRGMQVSLAGVDVTAVVPGAVVCHPEWPLRLAARLEARVVVLDVAVPILRGQQARWGAEPLPRFSVVSHWSCWTWRCPSSAASRRAGEWKLFQGFQ